MTAQQKRNELKEEWAKARIKRIDRVIDAVNDWTEYWDGIPITLSAEKMDILFLDHLFAVEVFQHLGYKVYYYHEKVYKNGQRLTKVMYRISL